MINNSRNDVDEWAVFSSKLYDYIEKIETWLHNTQKELESQGRCNGDLQTVEFLINENKVCIIYTVLFSIENYIEPVVLPCYKFEQV